MIIAIGNIKEIRMNKYLLRLRFDIADEGDVTRSEIVTEKRMNELIGTEYSGSFGNMVDDDRHTFEASDFKAITPEVERVLRDSGLVGMNGGYVYFHEED